MEVLYALYINFHFFIHSLPSSFLAGLTELHVHEGFARNRRDYWSVQAGSLTPLTFARHRLSPLAAFTSGAYFLHNGRR